MSFGGCADSWLSAKPTEVNKANDKNKFFMTVPFNVIYTPIIRPQDGTDY